MRSYNDKPLASTTSAQLRTATVRGEISASEEQVNIARAQSEREAIRYYADEAVKAGNMAAVIKDDQAYWIDYDSNSSNNAYTPPLQKRRMASQVGSINTQQSGSVDVSDSGTKKKMPWDAMQSFRSTFPTKMTTKKQEADKNDTNGSSLEKKVSKMMQQVLQESHNQSGALLLSEPTTKRDCKARTRVKLLIENPKKACAYIRMGLDNNSGMDMGQMIEMIDYYCA